MTEGDCNWRFEKIPQWKSFIICTLHHTGLLLRLLILDDAMGDACSTSENMKRGY